MRAAEGLITNRLLWTMCVDEYALKIGTMSCLIRKKTKRSSCSLEMRTLKTRSAGRTDPLIEEEEEEEEEEEGVYHPN